MKETTLDVVNHILMPRVVWAVVDVYAFGCVERGAHSQMEKGGD